MRVVLDGNQAAARVAYRCSEVVAIYPITPASPMGEYADQWSSEGIPNLWGEVPRIVEMQSEGGAAGAVHGSLQAGSLTTTFTASQGLLLMLPNMFKIAGELTSTVFHIAARTVATHALSIFGDHSDVMAVRASGWAMLFADSVQQAQDFALISHVATLHARVPFLHVFDGFRTSHEETAVEVLSEQDMLALLPADKVREHRQRALSPENPQLRGSAQNPDTFFQSREAANPYYDACPAHVEQAMRAFARQTGREYQLFEYVGHPLAERVVVAMGSACQTLEQTVQALQEQGERVGVLKVRLFRPFASGALLANLPSSVRRLAVLDRCREPGAVGEPLFQDVLSALAEAGRDCLVCGGRYGLASKEFTPAMAAAVFTHLREDTPRRRFTVGIRDDVSGLSLPVDSGFCLEEPGTVRAVFWGLGSDGTVGANKNTIRIIGEETGLYAQGYFVYDSKKAGARTVSHLRFGPHPIRQPYLIQKASFVAIHQWEFLRRYPVLDGVEPGASVLLNCPHAPEQAWEQLPQWFRSAAREQQLKLSIIDANRLARELGLGGRINTIMQTCFFALSGVLPVERAVELIKEAIRKTYTKQGEPVVRRNFAAVEAALENLHPLPLGEAEHAPPPGCPEELVPALLAGFGDELPVSAFPPDGTFPTATAHLEKRNLSERVPEWHSDLCIQCGKCVYVCPHSVVRAKLMPASVVPEDYETLPSAFKELPQHRYRLQISEADCTGCELCVHACPAHDRQDPSRKALIMSERHPDNDADWERFLQLPEDPPLAMRWTSVKNLQLRQPLFEFSGACAGCGETPYLRILSQLYGDHLLIANATGCSSIYGGNLPTTPWSRDRRGHGPAWSNSLFEDNAEFGLGMRLALDQQEAYARHLVRELSADLGDALAADLLDPRSLEERRQAVALLRTRLGPEHKDLLAVADNLIPHSVWIVGGDGWAYDIGYGGLDHVLASQARVRVLVLDTEVYSNTGGQASKATPFGAIAKFAAAGKPTPKKDLGLAMMAYETCYVASVAMGANEAQTLKAFEEAENFPGPALIIAYAHCIAHGIDMTTGMQHQKLAVDSGYWLLYRFDPRRTPMLTLDSRPPATPLGEYLRSEGRYRNLERQSPEEAAALLEHSQQLVTRRFQEYSERARACTK